MKVRKILGSVSNPEQFDSVISGIQDSEFWAYIYHDKDVMEDGSLKPKHLHFVAISAPRSFETWSNILGIPANMICKCFSLKDSLLYLTHAKNLDKFQYLEDNVVTSDKQKFYNYIKESDVDIMSEYKSFIDVRKGVISPSDYLSAHEVQLSKTSFYNRLRIYDSISRPCVLRGVMK